MSLFLFTILYGLHLDPFLKHNGAPCSDTQFPLEALRGLFNRSPPGVSVQRLASQRKEEPQHQVILQSLLISHCWSYFLWYLNSKADFLPAFALLFRCKRHTCSFLFPPLFCKQNFLELQDLLSPYFPPPIFSELFTKTSLFRSDYDTPQSVRDEFCQSRVFVSDWHCNIVTHCSLQVCEHFFKSLFLTKKPPKKHQYDKWVMFETVSMCLNDIWFVNIISYN